MDRAEIKQKLKRTSDKIHLFESLFRLNSNLYKGTKTEYLDAMFVVLKENRLAEISLLKELGITSWLKYKKIFH